MGRRGDDLDCIDAAANQRKQTLHFTQYIRAKLSPLTTRCGASQGCNCPGHWYRKAQFYQVDRKVKEIQLQSRKVHTEFAFKAK